MKTIRNDCSKNKYLTRDTIIQAVKHCTNQINYIDKSTCGCGFTHNLLKKDGLSIKDFNLHPQFDKIICITPNRATVVEKFKVREADDVYYQCEGIGKDANRCNVEKARVVYTTPDSAIDVLHVLKKRSFIFVDEGHKFIANGSFRSVCRLDKYKSNDNKIILVSATYSDKVPITVKVENLFQSVEIDNAVVPLDDKPKLLQQFLQCFENSIKMEGVPKAMFVANSTTIVALCVEIARLNDKKVKLIVGKKIEGNLTRLVHNVDKIAVDDVAKANVIICSNAGVEGWDYKEGDLNIHMFNVTLGKKESIFQFSLEEIKQAAGRVRATKEHVKPSVSVTVYYTYNAEDRIVPQYRQLQDVKKRGYLRSSDGEVKAFVYRGVFDIENEDVWKKPTLIINDERHVMYYRPTTFKDVERNFRDNREDIMLQGELVFEKPEELDPNQFRDTEKYLIKDLAGIYISNPDILAYLGHLQHLQGEVKMLDIEQDGEIFTVNPPFDYDKLCDDIKDLLDSKKVTSKNTVLLKLQNMKLNKVAVNNIKSILAPGSKITVNAARHGDIFKRGTNNYLDYDKITPGAADLRKSVVKYVGFKRNYADNVLKELTNLTRTPLTGFRQYNLFSDLGGGFLKDLKEILDKHGLPFYYKDKTAASPSCAMELSNMEIKGPAYTTNHAQKRKKAKIDWSMFTNMPVDKLLDTNWEPENVDKDLIQAFKDKIVPKLKEKNTTWHTVYTRWELKWWTSQKKIVKDNLKLQKVKNAEHLVFLNRLHDCITVFDPFDVFKGKDCFEKEGKQMLGVWGKIVEERENPPAIDPEVEDNYTAKNTTESACSIDRKNSYGLDNTTENAG